MNTPSERGRAGAASLCAPGAAPLALKLGAAQFLRLPHPRGLRLQAREGHLWITVDGQLRDIALAPGRCHVFDADTPALVTVFGAGAEFLAWRPAEPASQAQPAWALA